MKSWLFLDKLLPAHRRQQRGQTLVMFAFLSIFMILLLGLVLDSARLFILAVQAERIAEAASLAGALYMPDYFQADPDKPASPDGQYAVDRACAIARQNGITACPVGVGQIGVNVQTVPSNKYEIQVTVTLQANVFFLSYVAPNLSSATVARSAAAQYLPPIQLGARGSSFGDEIDGVQDFWARVDGPQEIKERGDAYTPLYQEGPDDARTTTDAVYPSQPYTVNRWPSAGVKTNHPQDASPGTNLDQQPDGFTGENGVKGYNYEIVVPDGNTTPLEIQIYNPAFAYGIHVLPDDTTNDDSLGDACNDPTYNVSGTCQTDQAGEYMQISYSLYSVSLPFERATDTLMGTWTVPSLDVNAADLADNGCSTTTQALNPATGTCVALPAYITQNTGTAGGYIAGWYPMQEATGFANGKFIYTNVVITNPGIYRLALEVTGGYGYHTYGVKVMTSETPTTISTTPPPDGVRLWAWNTMCVNYNKAQSSATFDLGEIPAAYAGKTLTLTLYDPGDAKNTNISLRILDPSGNPITFSAATYPWLNLTNGGTTIDASNLIYNGLWLRLPIPIPADYNPPEGEDWWQIEYTASGGTNNTISDTVTASIALSGSPIHLVSLIV